jgi:hypothetical protein
MVHGLWYGYWSMRVLGRHLRRGGFKIRHFAYPATSASLSAHAVRLNEFASKAEAETLHFVGHSLGGLVILRMLSEATNLPPGRIVLLGCPLGGSIVARRMRHHRASGKLLGEIRPALETGYSHLPADRETGMIAGSLGVGLGLLTGGMAGPGDGTVSLDETNVPGFKDRLVLPVSHTGLLFSGTAARQAANFLGTGRFKH